MSADVLKPGQVLGATDEGAFLRQFEILRVISASLTDEKRTPVVVVELQVDASRPVWTCTLGSPEQAISMLHQLFDAIQKTWPGSEP